MPLLAEPAAHWTAPPGTDNPPRCILRFLGKKDPNGVYCQVPGGGLEHSQLRGEIFTFFCFDPSMTAFFITMIK